MIASLAGAILILAELYEFKPGQEIVPLPRPDHRAWQPTLLGGYRLTSWKSSVPLTA